MIRLSLLLLLLLLPLLCACGERHLPSGPETPPEPSSLVSVEGLPWARLSPGQIEEATFLGIPAAFENERGMRFVYVPAGTFEMGSPDSEPGRSLEEAQHSVTLTMGYYLQVSPVTNAQMGRPGPGPATQVSYAEAVQFADALTASDSAWRYRLPSEAEWEHACRAGSQAAYAWGAAPRAPPASGGVPASNRWGLRGMHVGVREWCRDRYGPLPSWPVGDPLGPRAPDGTGQVVRGGGSVERPTRAAQRTHVAPDTRAEDLGFRLLAPVGYGLGRYGSVEVTFRLTDPLAGEGETPPETTYDLRIIKMNDRLSARMAGVETDWRLVKNPTLPVSLRMVPGKYYVYAETHRKGRLARGPEIKFHAWGKQVDVPVPIPERDAKRYGSGIDEKPQ
jgi:formylglycine-generating enzyme required for sulfatase activity